MSRLALRGKFRPYSTNMSWLGSPIASATHVPFTFVETTSGDTRQAMLWIPRLADKSVPMPLVVYHGGSEVRGDSGTGFVQNYWATDIEANMAAYPHFALFVQGKVSSVGDDPTNFKITLRSFVQAVGIVQAAYNINPKKIHFSCYSVTYAYAVAYLYPTLWASVTCNDGTMDRSVWIEGDGSTTEKTPILSPITYPDNASIATELARVIGPSGMAFLHLRSNNGGGGTWGAENVLFFDALDAALYTSTRHTTASTTTLPAIATSEKFCLTYFSALSHTTIIPFDSYPGPSGSGATRTVICDWRAAQVRP